MIILQICGAMRPMKPMTPVNARHADVTNAEMTRQWILRRRTLTPRLRATSSPPDNVLRSTAHLSMRMKHTATMGMSTVTEPHVAPHMLPISQLVTSRRALSSEMYFMNDIPAENR